MFRGFYLFRAFYVQVMVWILIMHKRRYKLISVEFHNLVAKRLELYSKCEGYKFIPSRIQFHFFEDKSADLS